MKEFNQGNIKQIRQDLQILLSAFAAANGLARINLGTIRYDSNSFRCKLDALTEGVVINTLTQRQEPGKPIEIGQIFRQKRTEYTVTAINGPGKFSISVQTHNGKRYKIKPESLLKMELIK